MSKNGLSEKQLEIYEFLKMFIISKGYPPSVREICEAVQLRSTSSVHAHLDALERKGYIRKDPAKTRSIEITEDNFYGTRRQEELQDFSQETVSLPVIGRVAAGSPILAEENIEDYFTLNAEFLPKGKDVFMLRVQGDSMINIGIYSGDYVMVRRENTARNGEVVVALVDDSATVKTFFKENGHFRLQPENDSMDPIIVDYCEILGVVIGLFRKF